MLYGLFLVLLSGALFSARATALVIGLQLATLLTAPLYVSDLDPLSYSNSLIFVGLVSLITLIGSIVRQHDEAVAERQTRALVESEGRFHRLFAASPDAIVLIDPHDPAGAWPIVDCNDNACRMNGYTREELIGQSIDILNATPGDPAERAAYLAQLRQAGVLRVEALHRHKSGRMLPVDISTSLIQFGERELVLGLDRDISQRKQSEHALEETTQQLRASHAELEQRTRALGVLTEAAQLLQACGATDEIHQVVSHSAPKLLPGAAGALYLYSPSRDELVVLTRWGEAKLAPAEEVFAPTGCWALRLGGPHRRAARTGGLACPHVDAAFVEAYVCLPMVAHGETLGVLHVRLAPDPADTDGGLSQLEPLAATLAEQLGLAVANLRLRETLRNQSIRDALTGLFNRRYLEETLERELRRAERQDRPVGLILLDLDHFKGFNDQFGHAAGDAVLREVGRFLNAHVRGSDIACRYGGEEFVLVFPDADLPSVIQRAGELCEGVRRLTLPDPERQVGAVTSSLGVAAFPEHGTTAAEVLQAADVALYRAKANGRDRVEVAPSQAEPLSPPNPTGAL